MSGPVSIPHGNDDRRTSAAAQAVAWLSARPSAAVCAVILMAIAVIVTVGPSLYIYQPNDQDLLNAFSGPSWAHPLGTDELGRDLAARLMIGTRTALLCALLAVAVAVVIGVPLGLLSGYWGGWPDAILTRVYDTIQSVPGLILVIAIVGVMGRHLETAMFALGILFSIRFYRLTRATTRDITAETYVEAAQAIGGSHLHIMFRHVLVNITSPLMVQLSLTLCAAILAESALSYLGLGVQVPESSLGTMLRDGSRYMTTLPWLIMAPGLVVFAISFSFNVLGESMRTSLRRGIR